MATYSDPEAQKAWEDLYKLIWLCPDPEGWGIRGKLEEAATEYGDAMRDSGLRDGWNQQSYYGDPEA